MNAPPACTSLRGPVRGRGNPFLRCLPCKGRCRATRGGGGERASDGCSQDGFCADQDPFLFSILHEKRNGSWTPKRKARQREQLLYSSMARHRDRRRSYSSGARTIHCCAFHLRKLALARAAARFVARCSLRAQGNPTGDPQIPLGRFN